MVCFHSDKTCTLGKYCSEATNQQDSKTQPSKKSNPFPKNIKKAHFSPHKNFRNNEPVISQVVHKLEDENEELAYFKENLTKKPQVKNSKNKQAAKNFENQPRRPSQFDIAKKFLIKEQMLRKTKAKQLQAEREKAKTENDTKQKEKLAKATAKATAFKKPNPKTETPKSESSSESISETLKASPSKNIFLRMRNTLNDLASPMIGKISEKIETQPFSDYFQKLSDTSIDENKKLPESENNLPEENCSWSSMQLGSPGQVSSLATLSSKNSSLSHPAGHPVEIASSGTYESLDFGPPVDAQNDLNDQQNFIPKLASNEHQAFLNELKPKIKPRKSSLKQVPDWVHQQEEKRNRAFSRIISNSSLDFLDDVDEKGRNTRNISRREFVTDRMQKNEDKFPFGIGQRMSLTNRMRPGYGEIEPRLSQE